MTEGLTLGEMRDLVSRISYKPGFSIGVDLNLFDPIIQVLVSGIVEPSRERVNFLPGMDTLMITFKYTCPTPHDKDELLRSVRKAVRAFEEHEADEWLALDGIVLNDPHHGSEPVKVRRGVVSSVTNSTVTRVPLSDFRERMVDL